MSMASKTSLANRNATSALALVALTRKSSPRPIGRSAAFLLDNEMRLS